MIPADIAGVVVLGVPLIIAAWVLLRQQPRPVFWFALALILVGIGYLMATGATDDIARSIVPASMLEHVPQPAG